MEETAMLLGLVIMDLFRAGLTPTLVVCIEWHKWGKGETQSNLPMIVRSNILVSRKRLTNLGCQV